MSYKLVVLPHDLRWAQAFEAEAGQIAEALGTDHVATHHIGSTAIAGIYAKPIIDILVEVVAIETADTHAGAMEALGYEVMGEFGIAGRRYFRKDNAQGVRTHHVHVFAAKSSGIHRHLAFRDFMRAHPALAQQYSELKRGLAAAYPDDIDQYMDGKNDFIQEMERWALAWAASKGPLVQ